MSDMQLSADDISRFIPTRVSTTRKGENGRVLVIGGSRMYHGAPLLAALSALRSGSDLVYAAIPNTISGAVRAASADVIVIPMADQKLTRGAASQLVGAVPLGLDSAAIGMGLDITDGLPTLVRRLTDMDVRLVLDAASLISDILPLVRDRNCILTPHAGEFRRIFGEEPPSLMYDRTRMVSDMARRFGVTILLKGVIDVISDGDTTYTCTGGSAAMTAGGTGDVLAGLTAGLLSRNRNTLEVAASAAFVNKRVGEHVSDTLGFHMVASDMIPAIPHIMMQFD